MPTAPISSKCNKNEATSTRGAWTAEEDQKLAQAIEIHGPRRWSLVAEKAGLKRCGKSCRLRWMNYLRPNIKRGNISDEEEDLILRLHKLLGNRWALIAGRLPGRTDNEIKNYWNSHLRKTIKQNEKRVRGTSSQKLDSEKIKKTEKDIAVKRGEEGNSQRGEESKLSFVGDEYFFDFSHDEPFNLEWTSKFLELDEMWFDFA